MWCCRPGLVSPGLASAHVSVFTRSGEDWFCFQSARSTNTMADLQRNQNVVPNRLTSVLLTRKQNFAQITFLRLQNAFCFTTNWSRTWRSEQEHHLTWLSPYYYSLPSTHWGNEPDRQPDTVLSRTRRSGHQAAVCVVWNIKERLAWRCMFNI